MKKYSISLTFFLFLAGFFQLSGQSISLESVELIDTSTLFHVTNPVFLGVDKTVTPNVLYYHFSHPGGGIQSSKGALNSGGRTPQNLPALGIVALESPLSKSTNKLQWVSARGASADVNYYVKPLAAAKDMSSQNLIASKGDIMSYEKEQALIENAVASSPFLTVEPIEKEEISPAEDAHYIDHYRTAKINVGMKGKISYIYVANHTLKENHGGLLGSNYKVRTEVKKGHVKDAFDREGATYKMSATKTFYSQINDPMSGNDVTLGGLKYKKNKEKKDSHFYEFTLLAYNNEGERINRKTFDTDQPMRVTDVYPIYGEKMAPGVDEVTHAIFVMQGDGKKGMKHINRKLFKILVVDMKTGKIIKEDEVEFDHSSPKLIDKKQFSDGKLELIYFYPGQKKRGFVVLDLGVDGIDAKREFPGSSPAIQAIGLPDVFLNSLELNTKYSFSFDDGGYVNITRLRSRTKENNRVILRTRGYALFCYDNAGHLVDIFGVGKFGKKPNFRFMENNNEELVLLITGKKKGAVANTATLYKVDAKTLVVNEKSLPEHEYLPSVNALYFDKAQRTLLLLAQKTPKKGVVLEQFKY